MGASIHYRTVKPPEGRIDVWTPSAFVEAMRRAFGEYPWRLGPTHITKLEGMAAAFGNGGSGQNPFDVIISKIALDDGAMCEIEVWPEY